VIIRRSSETVQSLKLTPLYQEENLQTNKSNRNKKNRPRGYIEYRYQASISTQRPKHRMLTSSFIAHPKDTQMFKKKKQNAFPTAKMDSDKKFAFSDYWDGKMETTLGKISILLL